MSISAKEDIDTAAIQFEPEFIEAMRDIFEEKVVFNKVMGLTFTSIRPDGITGHLPMKPELVGHFMSNRVHGGVISASLDAMGGLAVLAALGARHMEESPKQRLARFLKIGTIDLRVDYLRPAISEHFTLRAEVLRLGSRVASARMEFLDASGKLVSTGAGAYIVS